MSFEESGRSYQLPYKTFNAKKLLQDKGYKVIVKSPWHLHVEKKDSPVLLNVWPTANKYMVHMDSGATVYTNLLESVDRVFNPVKEPPPIPTPEEEEMYSFRKDPLGFIQRHHVSKR